MITKLTTMQYLMNDIAERSKKRMKATKNMYGIYEVPKKPIDDEIVMLRRMLNELRKELR